MREAHKKSGTLIQSKETQEVVSFLFTDWKMNHQICAVYKQTNSQILTTQEGKCHKEKRTNNQTEYRVKGIATKSQIQSNLDNLKVIFGAL